MNIRKDIVVSLGILAIVAGGLLLYWFFVIHSQQDYTAEQTPYKVLTQNDQSFSQAMILMRNGDYEKAQQALLTSLANADDSQSQAQIQFKIALATEGSGDLKGAIAQYKGVAANTRYYNQIRAYAVQQIGTIYYTYGSAHPEVVDEIFKDAPYAAMAEGVDTDMALRRLNEYASSLYPLAPALLRQADWYAADISKNLHNATTSDAAVADIAKIHALLTEAQPELDRMRKDPNETGPLVDALTREGTVQRRLALAGVVSPDDVIAPLRDALGLSVSITTVPGQDGFPRFLYAAALATFYGNSRADEITSTVAAFKPTAGAKNLYLQSIEAFLKNLHNSTDQQYNRSAAIKIAAVSPSFKSYLVSLGWTESDFTK